jgi:hypothetical protein
MFAATRPRRPAALGVTLFVLSLGACRNDDVTGASRPTVPNALAAVVTGNSAGAKRCQKGGWQRVSRADLVAFVDEGDCVSYVAMGGRFGQTITFTSTNPSPVDVGGASYRPRATASSGLPVTLSLDAASTGCSLTSGVVSFTAAGTCLINANQAGDAVWAPAPQVQQSITVNAKSQTITFTSANPTPVRVGDPAYAPQATATSGLSVTFSLDAASTGCTLVTGVVNFTSTGQCVINANQAGNATWAAAPQVSQSILVTTVNAADYCASLGGTFGGTTSTALWTCSGWDASSAEDARAKVDPLIAACRVDNGLITGPLDYSFTEPFPTKVSARCHLPNS